MSMEEQIPLTKEIPTHSRVGTWRTYDVTDGLAAGGICILQDSQGYLWIGTGAGLCRYDGERFVTFTSEDGLPDDCVYSLFQDSKSRIWIGGSEGHVAFLKDDLFYSFSASSKMPSCDIWSICEDHDGNIWIASFGGGIIRYDGESFTNYTTADGLSHDMVRSMLVDRSGRIWIGTWGEGICLYDGSAFTCLTLADGLSSNYIFCMREDAEGAIWIGTRGGGVSRYKDGAFQVFGVRDGIARDSVRSLWPDDKGNLWFGTVGGGLTVYDGTNFRSYVSQDGLLANHVSGVIEDREGYIWLSHSLAGVSCFDPWTIEYITDVPVSEVMYKDPRGDIWFGNENEVVCISGGVRRSRRFNCHVFGITEGLDGRFWIATFGGGVQRFDSAGAVWTEQPIQYGASEGLPSPEVMTLLCARDGGIYAGTAHPGCLCRLDGDRFTAIETPHPLVFRLFEDNDGRIWMGGYEGGGLSCYEDGHLKTFTTEDGLPTDGVQSLAQADDGTLWVGTQRGLAYSTNGGFRSLEDALGLVAFHHQKAVKDAGGTLWFGTVNSGIYRIHGDRLQWLTARDGLPSNSVTGLIAEPDGGVLIGTYRGIVRYHPTAKLPPKISIKEMTADGIYPEPSELELTTLQAQLVTIAYQGRSMGPYRMRYRYRLESFDADWHDTWDTQVRYENLPPGDYAFKVYAINRDLVESEEPAALHLHIIPNAWEQIQAEYEARIGEMEEQLEFQERVNRQNESLMSLAKSKVLEEGDLDSALQEITEAAAMTLGVERVGIWLVDTNRTALHCVDQFILSEGGHEAGTELYTEDHPRYFELLETDQIIVVADPVNDERTMSMAAGYLEPHAISAMLDVPIRVGGQTIGVVCHEHVGSPRSWTYDEQQFARSIASAVSLAIEAHDRRRAEIEINRIRQHLQNMIDSMPSVLIGVDQDGLVTHWNEEAARLTCMRADQARGYPFDTVFPMLFEKRDRILEAVHANAATEAERISTEMPDEGQRLFEFMVYPLTEDDNQGAVIRVDDVTARAQMEEIMVQTEKMMSVGGLAAGMAHEINNPLGGILQACQNIIRRTSPDLPKNREIAERLGIDLVTLQDYMQERGIVEFIEGIRSDGTRAAKIVADMLAFSRKSESHFAPARLDVLMDTALRLAENDYDLKKQYDFRRVSIQRVYEPDLPEVRCEKTKIEQVFLNLIKNAAQAMATNPDQAEPTITISTGSSPEFVEIEVIDNGPGMTEAVRKRVFEPFFTTKEVGVGTGLGLSVSYFIVAKQHRGTMIVDSTLGQGTRFVIRFPRERET